MTPDHATTTGKGESLGYSTVFVHQLEVSKFVNFSSKFKILSNNFEASFESSSTTTTCSTRVYL